MLQSMLGVLSADLAVDLGTSQTRIAQRGRGIVVQQASALALHEDPSGRRRILCVGDEALRLLGRTPADVRVVQPIRDGAVVEFDMVEALLRQLVLQVHGRRLWVAPRAVVCVPHGLSDVERRALREAVEASGAREVSLVDLPVANAIGAELPVNDARGNMIVDVGGGTTTVAVLSMGGVVHHHRMKLGGTHLDQAIIHHLRQEHGLLIGAHMAEEIKLHLASALPGLQAEPFEARGRALDTGWPGSCLIDADEVHAAIAEPVRMIVDAVLSGLEHTPPDLASDVAETGIVLAGGGGLLADLDRAIGEATGLPVVLPEEPSLTAVRGAGAWGGGASAPVALAG